ncbi:MAG: hypothetical protein ACFFDT_09145 [Candidatus Hodarchaeota archaeon]
MYDRRDFERFKPLSDDLKVELVEIGKDQDPINGRVQDISKSGVFIWDCYSSDETVKLIFKAEFKKPIIRNAIVKRKDKKDVKDQWIALRFEKPLSDFELSRIKEDNISLYLPGESSTYDLSRIDRSEVFREANQIKTCSSNYFSWSIAIIVPFTVGIWALFLAKKLNAFSASSSMIGIIIVFSTAVFSNIEKSRAINKREGFIAALDYYLKNNEGPQNYRGWVNLKHCIGECRARLCANLCPIIKRSNDGITCQKIGENKSNLLRSNKKIIPSILDSFISLTSFFYSLIFIGLTILTEISFSKTWQELNLISSNTTLVWFTIGFFASVIVLKNILLLIGAVLAVIIMGIGGVVFTDQFFIKITTLGLGMITGSIGWFFLKQLYKIRKGIYSFEAYTHSWLEVFENCIFLPEDAAQYVPSPTILDRMRDRIKGWYNAFKFWE